MLEDNNFNYTVEPTQLIDEISSNEYYIGYSINGIDQTKNIWKIKKIIKIGTIWHFQFPQGNQTYVYTWSDRFSYPYV